MNALAEDIRSVIARHVRHAPRETLLTIAAHLADDVDAGAPPLEVARSGQRLTTIGDDQVLDSSTDLIWTRGNVPGGQMNWKAAHGACKEFNLGGASNWRLPTIKELLTLVDYERTEPAIDPIFQCEKNWYWTSTPYAGTPAGCAWVVVFSDGLAVILHQSYEFFVRAVRPRQSL